MRQFGRVIGACRTQSNHAPQWNRRLFVEFRRRSPPLSSSGCPFAPGVNNPYIVAAEHSIREITELSIPTRRVYFKKRLDFIA